jgi:Helicase HerA, central domain
MKCLVESQSKMELFRNLCTSKVIERLQELSLEGVKIILSHGLIQLQGTDTKEELQQASYNVNKEQISRGITHKGNPDLELMMKHQDIVSNYREIYLKSKRTFQSSFIIVIKGGEEEVFRAESHIISILKSELIEVQIPTGRILEMFLSALLLPVSESKAWVEVRSDGAAALCAASNLNSRTDEKGLYFGKDLLTNSEVMLDLNTLASKQLVMCGSTGSGKTFTFLLLLMRLVDMCNARVIYTTPKADEGTKSLSEKSCCSERYPCACEM